MTPAARMVLAGFERASGITFEDREAPTARELNAMMDAIASAVPRGNHVPVALRSAAGRERARQAAEAMLAHLDAEAPAILARWAQVWGSR